MAEVATLFFNSERLRTNVSSPLGEPLGFDLRGLGRRLPQMDDGRRVRQKKEKTLGPASMAKHEAQRKLVEYIEEYTGRITKQGNTITTFADLWNAYCAVRSGQRAKKTKEDLRYLLRNTLYRS